MNFNYSEFINLIQTFASTLIATFIGGVLAYKLNLKLQSKVIRKQIKVQELKSLLSIMYEYKDSLLALQINFGFFHDIKSRRDHIEQRLSDSNRIFGILEKELYLNEIIFKEYGITINDIKKESKIISDSIDYKISDISVKVEEYEKLIKEKSINDRIEALMKIIAMYIEVLQREYVIDL